MCIFNLLIHLLITIKQPIKQLGWCGSKRKPLQFNSSASSRSLLLSNPWCPPPPSLSVCVLWCRRRLGGEAEPTDRIPLDQPAAPLYSSSPDRTRVHPFPPLVNQTFLMLEVSIKEEKEYTAPDTLMLVCNILPYLIGWFFTLRHGEAFCKRSFSEFIAWKVKTKCLLNYMRRKVNKVKSLGPFAKGNTAWVRMSACGTLEI